MDFILLNPPDDDGKSHIQLVSLKLTLEGWNMIPEWDKEIASDGRKWFIDSRKHKVEIIIVRKGDKSNGIN